MHSLYLFRHGDSINDLLTPMGSEQVRLACERFKRVWDNAPCELYHAPSERTRASAKIVSRALGVPSVESDLLAIRHHHTPARHRLFAELVVRDPVKNLVLVGHAETTEWCIEVVFRSFRKIHMSVPPEVPQGGLMRYTEKWGYELI